VVEMIGGLKFLDIIFFIAVLVLIILIVLLVYIFRDNKDNISSKSNDEIEEIDLESLTKRLEKDSNKNQNISLTNYEKEQEKSAIISYDELVNTQSIPKINYTNELDLDGLSVKSINVNDLINNIEPKPIESNKINEVKNIKTNNLISYDKEEAFLSVLKQLENNLNI
jgi:ribosomal protein L2